jgi:hypothetical protein
MLCELHLTDTYGESFVRFDLNRDTAKYQNLPSKNISSSWLYRTAARAVYAAITAGVHIITLSVLVAYRLLLRTLEVISL